MFKFKLKTILGLFIVIFAVINCGLSYSVQSATETCVSPKPPDDERIKNIQKYTTTECINDESSICYWKSRAQNTLTNHLSKQHNTNTATNIIFFLGDGMSLATITAGRIYQGQKAGEKGENNELFLDKFPYVGLAKTYCVDKQVPDSACTATAYLAGVKTNYATIGVTSKVKLNDCDAANIRTNHVVPITKLALAKGKSVGIVTTSRITDATPAGSYAHVANRAYECDNDTIHLKKDPKVCQDIASQLIFNDPGKDFQVIFGGGRGKFIPFDKPDPQNFTGDRRDGVNLIDEWRKSKKGKNAKYIYNRKGLESLQHSNVDHVLGLFDHDRMPYNLDATDNVTKITLVEMTLAAIRILEKNKNGYFLFVEGGLIDVAHHDSRAQKALDETVEFSKAIQRAVDMVDLSNTLIVVTADHSHTMTMAGYSERGDNILSINRMKSDVDHLPYTTLAYANGPGYNNSHGTVRKQYTEEMIVGDKDFQYPGIFPNQLETHGGDDVIVYAMGPWAHLFTGSYEQNVIPTLMSHAGCLDDEITCNLKN